MNTLIHADIFFFITAIAVVVVTILIAVILFYIARTARTVSKMVEQIRIESDQVLEDLSRFREKVKESGNHVSGFGKWLITFILGKTAERAFKGSAKKSARSKTQADSE